MASVVAAGIAGGVECRRLEMPDLVRDSQVIGLLRVMIAAKEVLAVHMVSLLVQPKDQIESVALQFGLAEVPSPTSV